MNIEPWEIRAEIGSDIFCTSVGRDMERERFPDEWRYAEAVTHLDRIEATLFSVPEDLLLQFNAAWERGQRKAQRTWNDVLMRVGFYPSPATATDLIEQFLVQVEHRAH